ncbi:ABC transporter substrate-binding protein [Alsobacter metallidurans]|uniref:ABC transporter substrate-binding protein n=1 Tax=Alsobacter metallidurans TaxID=340221 RepID=A0A917MJJ6_9HYPH|nr:ABC transporter substrate-binding protein [Alsobacter metallidurans]GGH27232.1 ABC transporter substrate-binding protein [Alsobacter metallidurans]
MSPFKLIAAAAAALLLAGSAASAQAPEKKDIKLGVGGKALLYYLPLTIAERKGFFKEQGLDVEISDFAGGAKSLQGLVGGSLDVVTGAYEHTIRMQAKGQDIRAVLELGRFPGIAVGIAKAKADAYKSPKDLKGMKIGVTAPGSSTNMLVNFLLAKEGLTPQDASFIGVGSAQSAVASIRNGQLDAISHLEPVLSMLERSGDIKIVVDTRTEEGTKALFGGSNPAAVLYVKKDFIDKNPNTVQALTNSLYKALVWINKSSPAEIAAAVPEEYLLGDKELYELAVKNSKPTYSQTGIVTESGMKSTLDMLKQFDAELKDAKVDLATTFDDRFAKKAAASVK